MLSTLNMSGLRINNVFHEKAFNLKGQNFNFGGSIFLPGSVTFRGQSKILNALPNPAFPPLSLSPSVEILNPCDFFSPADSGRPADKSKCEICWPP